MELPNWIPLANSKSREDFDRTDQVVLRLSKFNKKDINEAYLRKIREGLKNEEYIDQEKSKFYGLELQRENGTVAINAEIVYPDTAGFIADENTDIHICDHHYYDNSMNDFFIPSKREIVVSELPEQEKDIEIADPWSMINRFDKYPNEDIYVVESEKKYLCNGYYFCFSEK